MKKLKAYKIEKNYSHIKFKNCITYGASLFEVLEDKKINYCGLDVEELEKDLKNELDSVIVGDVKITLLEN